MLGVDAAIGHLLERARVLAAPGTAKLQDARGRALAADIVAAVDVPPADNSAMDGYALRHRDRKDREQPLELSQRIVAGVAPAPLAPGTAARIFTGAEIPAGADTVVMQEHTERAESGVLVLKLPQQGSNIRPRGQDIRQGQVILRAGARLRAQEVGLLASVGLAEVPVYRPLRVAIVANGDELVEPGQPAGPGQIYNSNRHLLRALLADWGFEIVDLGIGPDDPDALAALLLEAARRADVILSTGGVSVGEEDHVKPVVASLGGIDMWKVAVKPGKPLAFGHVRDTFFLGLPGNPASAWVTALVFARPFLFRCQGLADVVPAVFQRRAAFSKRGSDRQEYLRARDGEPGVALYPNQSSGVLLSASWGDGLVVQAPGQDITEGDTINFLPYQSLR